MKKNRITTHDKDYSSIQIDPEIQNDIDNKKRRLHKKLIKGFTPKDTVQTLLKEMVMREYIEYTIQKKYPRARVMKTSHMDDIMAGIDYLIVLPGDAHTPTKLILADLAISINPDEKHTEKSIKLDTNSSIPHDIMLEIARQTKEKKLMTYDYTKIPIVFSASLGEVIYAHTLNYIEHNGELPADKNIFFDDMMNNPQTQDILEKMETLQEMITQKNTLEKRTKEDIIKEMEDRLFDSLAA